MKILGVPVSAGFLQPLGRALMLPIAVLPVAGLLLRLGQQDMLNVAFVAAAGDAVFHNLGLLFAIGVAVGFAKDGNGAAGLAGAVCFLVAANGAQVLIHVPAAELAKVSGKARDLTAAAFKATAVFKLSVPLGILSGVFAGNLYNRFGAIKLPDYLAFFGGRRFVPIVSGLAGLVLALVFGLGWTTLNSGVDAVSRAIVAAGPLGLFIYGVLNRLLLVTGLHHVLNNIAWFIVGDYHGVTGDLNRFFAGDPTAGAFMAGFFPVMMFGLPAACLAMFHTAKPERRAEVGGMLLSLALTALLTGVTEPIEFSFMFLAPMLFALHAILTGTAMVLMSVLGVKLGFGFSAGLFDYALNFSKSTRPLLLIPIGLTYFVIYYGLFRVFILHFKLRTPGREDEPAAAAAAPPASEGGRADGYIAALGGPGNLVSVAACTTRLRLVVADQAFVDEKRLRALGARGVIRPSGRDLQVVVGAIADQVAREIVERLAGQATAQPQSPPAPSAAPTPRRPPAPAAAFKDAGALLAALGGRTNVTAVVAVSSRLRVSVVDGAGVDEASLRALGVRGVVRPTIGAIQVVLGPAAENVAARLAALLPGGVTT